MHTKSFASFFIVSRVKTFKMKQKERKNDLWKKTFSDTGNTKLYSNVNIYLLSLIVANFLGGAMIEIIKMLNLNSDFGQK